MSAGDEVKPWTTEEERTQRERAERVGWTAMLGALATIRELRKGVADRLIRSDAARLAYNSDPIFHSTVRLLRVVELHGAADPVVELGELLARGLIADRQRLLDAELRRRLLERGNGSSG